MVNKLVHKLVHKRPIKIALLTLLLAAGITAGAATDEITDLLELMSENVFSVNIVCRIYQGGEVSTWNMEVSKYTISGRKVIVNLQGSNLQIKAEITPYVDKEGVLLLAQGQVWANEEGEKKVRYSSTMKSLPVQFGDKVFFYPLGINKDPESKMFILELEIQVLPYKNIAKSETE
jgi:hypothetical protein